MAIRTEISLRLQNSPGALGQVCQHLDEERVNVLALSLDGSGTLRLIVDNPLQAAGTLTSQRYEVEQRDVLLLQLPNDPGSLRQATGLLSAAGVNVDYLYASALEDSPMVAVIVGVEDAQRAAMQAGL